MSTFKNSYTILNEGLGSYYIDLRHSEFIIGDSTVGSSSFTLILPSVNGTGFFKLIEGTKITIEDPNGYISGNGPKIQGHPNDTLIYVNGVNSSSVGYQAIKTAKSSYTLVYEGGNLFTLSQGAPAVTGSQGNQGPTGPTGPQGTAGTNGTQGNQGPVGFQGNTGPQGNQGRQGPQGNQGPIGDQGSQGRQGPQGNQGPTGQQGNQGPAGTGAQGIQGSTGQAVALNYATQQGTQITTSTNGATLVSKVFTATGNPIQIMVVGDANPLSAGVWGQLQIYRDSTAIGTVVQYESNGGNENVPYALNVIDNPSGGVYTYSMKVNTMAGGSTQFGESAGPYMTIVDLAGALGPQGRQGPNGVQGNNGVQGFQGIIGPQGNQGPTGFQGNNGPQGNQGPTGLQGFTGPQGNQGPVGTGQQGNQGPTGTGTQGNQGPLGPQGRQGPQGNQGPTGADSSVAGPQGRQGPTGTGNQGFTGPQGNQGPTGTGAQGNQGPQGIQGPSGIDGIAGANGIQGAAGTNGSNGSNGPQGNQGPLGPQGNQGPSGTDSSVAGPPGPQGRQGPSGADSSVAGPQGRQGPSGADSSVAGPQGRQGPSGADSSVAGPQGRQGPTGSGFTTSGTYYIQVSNGSGGVTSSSGMTGNTSTNVITAAGFYQSSSRTLKTNIAEYTDSATDLLKSVDVVSFNYKNDLENQHIGFIAEDTPIELSTKEQNSMDTNSTVGILIKAIQELEARIKELENPSEYVKK